MQNVQPSETQTDEHGMKQIIPDFETFADNPEQYIGDDTGVKLQGEDDVLGAQTQEEEGQGQPAELTSQEGQEPAAQEGQESQEEGGQGEESASQEEEVSEDDLV